jgi:hypothetical protein
MTENELAGLGFLAIGDKALRIEGELTVEGLTKLTEEELYSIGINRLNVSELAQEQSLDLGKKAASQRWWVGKVFWEIKRRKNREWSGWLKSKGLEAKRTTIDDAISLSERMTLERASELGLTDAMREAGVWEERKAPQPKDSESTSPVEEEEEEEDEAKDAHADNQPTQNNKRQSKKAGVKKSDSGDGDEDKHQNDAPTREPPPAPSNGNGQPSDASDTNEITDKTIELTLTLTKKQTEVWFHQVCDQAPADTFVFKLALTRGQIDAVREQMEENLDSHEPANLADL